MNVLLCKNVEHASRHTFYPTTIQNVPAPMIPLCKKIISVCAQMESYSLTQPVYNVRLNTVASVLQPTSVGNAWKPSTLRIILANVTMTHIKLSAISVYAPLTLRNTIIPVYNVTSNIAPNVIPPTTA